MVYPGTRFLPVLKMLWKCWDSRIRRWCPAPWNSGARRFQRPETRPFTTKTYGTRTTKRISRSSSRNAPLTIHPHHCSKILFQNEDSHSKTSGWSIPTYGRTKGISSSSRNAREKYTALTIHPHHCSKILFQNEDSHSKNILGCDSSLSLSKYRLVNPNLRYRCDKTYQQQHSIAVGTLEKNTQPRRFILITAVKFYSKMKTPTQKIF